MPTGMAIHSILLIRFYPQTFGIGGNVSTGMAIKDIGNALMGFDRLSK